MMKQAGPLLCPEGETQRPPIGSLVAPSSNGRTPGRTPAEIQVRILAGQHQNPAGQDAAATATGP